MEEGRWKKYDERIKGERVIDIFQLGENLEEPL